MIKFSKIGIKNHILRTLAEGGSTRDALNQYLMMRMSNDADGKGLFGRKTPYPADISMHLMGNGVISDADFGMEKLMTLGMRVPRLVVKLSPTCSLYMETVRNTLYVTINDVPATTMYVQEMDAEEVAMWVIRQKQNLETYLEDWESVLNEVSKKTKNNRMAMLAIKAIVTEAMKECPWLSYSFVEQKRRMRVMVKFPNSNLGVYIDAWWGSYRKKLPAQLASLKELAAVQRNTALKDFFVSGR